MMTKIKDMMTSTIKFCNYCVVVFPLKVFLNPHFVKKTFNNDIALIKMKGEVT